MSVRMSSKDSMPDLPTSSRWPGDSIWKTPRVFALLISLVAYSAVGLAVDGRIPSGVAGYGAGLGGLFLLAHLVVRRWAPYADPLIVPCVALLNGLGLVMIRRLDFAAAERALQVGKQAPAGEALRGDGDGVLGAVGDPGGRLACGEFGQPGRRDDLLRLRGRPGRSTRCACTGRSRRPGNRRCGGGRRRACSGCGR